MSGASYRFYRNTPEEEAEIERGIQMDPDTFVPSDEWFAQMKPWADRLPSESPAEQIAPPR
ncbi:hypothetical protein YK56LOC_09020 [Caballeronia sp. HLA56]